MSVRNLNKKQRETLAALEKLARRAGLKVSYGRLNYAGLRFKGGGCRCRGRDWLIIDRLRSFEDQLEVFQSVLKGRDWPEDTEAGLLRLLAADSPKAGP